MRSIPFKKATGRLTGVKNNKGQDQPDVHVYVDLKSGQSVSCWRAPFLQRLAFLFHGRIWVQIWSQGKQPPIAVHCLWTIFFRKKIMINKKK